LGLYDGAAQRHRALLILAGKVILSGVFANNVERKFRFPFRLEDLTGLALKCPLPPRTLDNMRFVFLRYRRKRQDVPISLLHYVADQVVLVQPLHDNNDYTGFFIVEATKKSVAVPVVNTVAPGFR